MIAALLVGGIATGLAAPAAAQPGGSLSSGSGSGNLSTGSGALSTGSGGSVGALPIPSPRGLAALAAATTQAGKRYVWGGNGPDVWDCSGLVQWAFRTVGVELPRTSQQMARFAGGVPVPLSALQPGDVITMDTYDIAGHVGIYAGFGMVFNAYGSGVPIGLTPLSSFRIHNIKRYF